jgi:hypothetical protein
MEHLTARLIYVTELGDMDVRKLQDRECELAEKMRDSILEGKPVNWHWATAFNSEFPLPESAQKDYNGSEAQHKRVQQFEYECRAILARKFHDICRDKEPGWNQGQREAYVNEHLNSWWTSGWASEAPWTTLHSLDDAIRIAGVRVARSGGNSSDHAGRLKAAQSEAQSRLAGF